MAKPASPGQMGRVRFFDTVRGLTIISMVAFHTVYDLVYLYGIDVPWFTFWPLQELWRISVSWVFLSLAGWMTVHSRSNLKRAVTYGTAALAIWIATGVAAVDTPISFGIVYCMAASTLIWAIIERSAGRLIDAHPRGLALALLAAFLILYEVPRRAYGFIGLEWLGFPSPGFSSGDYYPLIPFSLLYLSIAVYARSWKRRGGVYPTWMYGDPCPALSALGRLSLPIYLLHQVVILIVLEAFLG